jgi:hypothetical protein
MGATVFAGMIGVTRFGLFLTPVFYVLMQRRKAAAALPAPGAQSLPASPALESSHG